MVKRLSESYATGDAVQITFDEVNWRVARVIAHDPPGMWVQTEDGRRWFVTNTRRVRPISDEARDS